MCIEQVSDKKQLDICINIIHRSFSTVAADFGLTKENCPGHTAFIPIEKIEKQFYEGRYMFLYKHSYVYAGYFSLVKCGESSYELDNLAVLPEYRHLKIGTKMIEFAKSFVMNNNANQIKIGIIDENTILKKWYEKLDFIYTGRRKFNHLPFTVGFMEWNTPN